MPVSPIIDRVLSGDAAMSTANQFTADQLAHAAYQLLVDRAGRPWNELTPAQQAVCYRLAEIMDSRLIMSRPPVQ